MLDQTGAVEITFRHINFTVHRRVVTIEPWQTAPVNPALPRSARVTLQLSF